VAGRRGRRAHAARLDLLAQGVHLQHLWMIPGRS
jgi:hypothetical protein